MASVASGLTRAQKEPRTLPLYLPLSSRRAKSATRPRYRQTSEVTLGIDLRRPALCSAAAASAPPPARDPCGRDSTLRRRAPRPVAERPEGEGDLMLVGLDATPLLGQRTGIGRYVGGLLPELVRPGPDAGFAPVDVVATAFSLRGRGGLPTALPDGVRN